MNLRRVWEDAEHRSSMAASKPALRAMETQGTSISNCFRNSMQNKINDSDYNQY